MDTEKTSRRKKEKKDHQIGKKKKETDIQSLFQSAVNKYYDLSYPFNKIATLPKMLSSLEVQTVTPSLLEKYCSLGCYDQFN